MRTIQIKDDDFKKLKQLALDLNKKLYEVVNIITDSYLKSKT